MADLATQCLRQLLLPVRPDAEATCSRILSKFLSESDIDEFDYSSWISHELDLWRDGEPTSLLFRELVTRILNAAGVPSGVQFTGRNYFALHSKLIEALMNHDEARSFIGNALLMCDLAQKELQSAAQISRLLSGRSSTYSRQAIEILFSNVKIKVELNAQAANRLFDEDSQLEIAEFADADLATSINHVANIVPRYGLSGDIKALLSALTPRNDLSRYGPYLQVLHYQCTIAEFFDHAVTDLYEFSPRGVIAERLFSRYPSTLATAGNPFLNNMKSVAKIDELWALSKKPSELLGARSLWRILDSLESLGFAARREACRILRIWVHRVIRLSLPNQVLLPKTLSRHQVDALLAWVNSSNTSTFGVVEQRVVDVVATNKHLIADGWRSRGVGDTVNTTNLSRRKIGDCDFQNTARRVVVAYEAHGGTLTDIYVNDHIRTLGKVLDERKDELSASAELSDWRIRIVFVAHDFKVSIPTHHVVLVIPIELEFVKFSIFTADQIDIPTWEQLLLNPLADARTPNEIKRASQQIFSITNVEAGSKT